MSGEEIEVREEAPKRTGLTMTYSQSVNRIQEIEAEMSRLAEKESLTPEEESFYEELRDEVFEVNEHRKRLERADKLAQVKSVRGQVDVAVKSRGYRIDGGTVAAGTRGSRGDYDRDAIMEPDSIEECRFRNPWDLSEMRMFNREQGEVAGELRARALSAIERMQGASDNVRQAATHIIENFDDKDSKLAKQCLVTSSPAYLRAWSKMSRNLQHLLTREEARALSEVRAMSLTDSAGGYLVPFQLDPTVIITSNGSLNEIRQAARQVVATGDKWHGVSSAAVSWSWDGEAAEVSDDATTFAQPAITVHKAQGFVPISIEALEDEQNVTQTVATLLAEGKDELESVALITGLGDGSNQPVGIVTALNGTSSEVAVATPETFALADVYALYGALPARHRTRASWLANNLVYNRIRQFDTSGGGGFWTNLNDGRPPQLIGRPALEAEAMDGSWNAAQTADNFIAIFGNFQNYVIADRVGMTVEFIPHLFATGNNRPNGTRGWYAYTRMGADSVNDGAFRVLNLETAS